MLRKSPKQKQPKEKDCSYKPCPETFFQFKSTDKYCSLQCKLKDIAEKEINKKVSEYKESVYGDNVFKILQTEINKTVRLIDRGAPCISSGLPYGSYYVNAGHYFGVGAHPALRYNLLNIFNQSKKDNDEFGGKGSTYGLKLEQVFGSGVRDKIEGLVALYPKLKLTRDEARKALKIVRQINRELENVDIVFSTEYRIEVRKKLNERIGIYKT
jgi:hypothetical protein